MSTTEMSKGERTREMIVSRSAALFNAKGYGRVSLSDIMRETGLEKGGIYNHFRSKEEIALHAFEHMVGIMGQYYRDALAGKTHAIDRLKAVLSVMERVVADPVIVGGCPLMNAAIESDDADPILRERVQVAMTGMIRTVEIILQRGIARGEVRPEVNPQSVASMIVAALEGAIMLSKLYGDPVHMVRTLEHLNQFVDRSIRL